MAISTYDELKTAISDWMDRTDIDANAADMVTLAEARLNRELKAVETNATVAGTVGLRTIDITSLNVVEPIALFLVDTNGFQEYEMVLKPDGSFPYYNRNGYPSIWARNGESINFNCLLDQAYNFRFRYVGRFALSDAAPTNELLTKHPDIYLAACIVWGGMFVADDAATNRFAGPLEAFMREHKRLEERNRRGRLTVDPALQNQRGTGYWGWYGGW